jgi:hypothetical protein
MFTIPLGESIASEGEGEYTGVEDRVLIPSGGAHSGRGHCDVGDGRQR